ncbi:MAG: hypothetical protein ACLQAT_28800 [Candidatus Binataceae bacterium]
MKKYDVGEERTRQIEEEAKKQQTQWEEVIAIFNEFYWRESSRRIQNR